MHGWTDLFEQRPSPHAAAPGEGTKQYPINHQRPYRCPPQHEPEMAQNGKFDPTDVTKAVKSCPIKITLGCKRAPSILTILLCIIGVKPNYRWPGAFWRKATCLLIHSGWNHPGRMGGGGRFLPAILPSRLPTRQLLHVRATAPHRQVLHPIQTLPDATPRHSHQIF